MMASNTLPVARGNYAGAEPLYQRSLATNEEALGPDHTGVATLLTILAALLFSLVLTLPARIIVSKRLKSPSHCRNYLPPSETPLSRSASA